MSELPRKAAAVLALGKRAHDPDDATVVRVRARVAQAVASDVDVAKGQPPSAGARKISMPRALTWRWVSVGAVVLVGSGLVLTWPHGAPQPSLPRRAKEVQQTPSPTQESAPTSSSTKLPRTTEASAAVEEGKAPTQSARRSSAPRHAKKLPASEDRAPSHAPQDSLAAEVRLLKSSSAALDENEPERALQILQQYRDTFDRPIMQREHDGLRILARCALDEQAAVAEAKDLLANDPTSVLRVKIIRVCKLHGG